MTNKRGRISAADLSIVHIDTARTIEPPADLKDKEAAIFRDVVASCSPRHFCASDIPMLVSFATATVLTRHYASLIGEQPNALKDWEVACRMQTSLATKLRLTPQTRYGPKASSTLSNEEARGMPRPWEVHASPGGDL
jgi:hypothetical protein